MIQRQAHVPAGGCRLAATDQRLDIQYLTCILVAYLLLAEEVQILVILLVYHLVFGQVHCFVSLDKVHEPNHLVVAHCYTARGLIGYMHIVSLLDQSCKRAAHTDHIVVGVRREDHHVLRERLSPLRAIAVICVRLAARPTRDCVLQVVEHLDVTVVCRTEQRDQLCQTVIVIILVRQFQDRLVGLLAQPNDGLAYQLVVPLATGHHPRLAYSCQPVGCRQVKGYMCIRRQLQCRSGTRGRGFLLYRPGHLSSLMIAPRH